jgi:uncharacterized membrane protein YphA (DoxX/SURF4 family)
MITSELVKYIKNSMVIGESQDVIVSKLLLKGWTQSDIQEAFGQIAQANASIQGVKVSAPLAKVQENKKKSFAESMAMYAPSVVRYAMSLVVLWFGIQQFIDTSSWLAYVPDSAVSMTHLSATALVYINGTIEVVFGTLLMFGWKTRWVALILSLHLFDIMYIVGYGEIGVRDFGLAMALFTIFMNGPDLLSFDSPYSVE